MPLTPLPDDFQFDGAAPQSQPTLTPLPGSFQPDGVAPEAVTVTGQRPETAGQQLHDLAGNVATGVARIPGAIIGAPHAVAHAANWLYAQLGNAWNGIRPDGTWREGADYDESDPLTKHTLSSEDVDKGVFKGISAVTGHDVQPYNPESFIGKLLQAGVTGAGAAALDPLAFFGALKTGATGMEALKGAAEGIGGRMAKTALASDAASATQQVAPDSPGLSAFAALLAHSAAGTAIPVVKAGFNSTIAPLLSPTARGRMAAGGPLSEVDNTQPGLANPSALELNNAKTDVAAATGKIGAGQDDYDAGGVLRDQLQGQKDVLSTARKSAADDAYGVFRSQPPMPGSELAPFMGSKFFRQAVKDAAEGAIARGDHPVTDYFHFRPEDGGEPSIIPGAAVPPDVLDRINQHLSGAADSSTNNTTSGDIGALRTRYLSTVEARYPQTYPAARQGYALNSRPLDPLETGPTAKVLDADEKFGRRTYTMPQDKVVRAYLQQNSTSRSSFNNLIEAFGGDKAKALGAIQDNLASKVQDAINSDGTLSSEAFERAVRPYTKALDMWFPDLKQKFGTAKSAQSTFENLTSQKALADDIGANQALRGKDNFVTRDAATKWLDKNADVLTKTQSPAAVMRLRKIAESLPDDPAAGAQAAVEAAPMLVGGALGGSEGGVLGGITHKIPAYLAQPLLKRYYESYSQAVEKAFTDPASAAALAQQAVKFGGFKNVLRKAAKDAALATLPALNASRPVAPQ